MTEKNVILCLKFLVKSKPEIVSREIWSVILARTTCHTGSPVYGEEVWGGWASSLGTCLVAWTHCSLNKADPRFMGWHSETSTQKSFESGLWVLNIKEPEDRILTLAWKSPKAGGCLELLRMAEQKQRAEWEGFRLPGFAGGGEGMNASCFSWTNRIPRKVAGLSHPERHPLANFLPGHSKHVKRLCGVFSVSLWHCRGSRQGHW